MNYPRVVQGLPGWVEELVSDPDCQYPMEEDRMRLAIELSRQNVARGTGGPFGAVPWSGVRRLACGAWDENARDSGFDEGPRMPGWIPSLERRGIAVVCDVCRDEAATVLKEYAEDGA